MDIKETIDLLMQMQTSLQHVRELEKQLSDNPKRVSALEKDSEDKKMRVEAAEQRLKDEKINHSKLENELKSLQELRSNKNLQTLEVKTNEQLWALQKEIKFIEEKASDVELQIIQAMEDIESRQQEFNEAKTIFEKQKKSNDEEISKLKSEVGGVEDDLAKARESYNALAAKIPSRYGSLLERIQSLRGGEAMARAVNSACSICHFRIRPQAFLELKLAKAIHQCPNCSRILYYQPEEQEEE